MKSRSILSRNCLVGTGSAAVSVAALGVTDGDSLGGRQVFGETPNTATERVALSFSTASIRFWVPSACWLGLAALLGLWHPRLAAQEQGLIAIDRVTNAQDTVAFTFTSTWPPGTSYQLQFRRSLQNSWADVPDALVEPVAPQGAFLVTAPKFGGLSGFYRLSNSASLTNDPVRHTLDEPDPEEIILLWNQPRQGATTNTVSGKLYYHVQAPPGGSLGNTLRAYPATNSPPFDFGPALPVRDNGAQDILLTDLTGDGRVDPLFVWANPGGTVTLTFVEISPTNFNWQVAASFNLSTLLVRPFGSVPPLLRLAAVRIDDDPNPEVVLAYTGLDGFVHIAVLEFNADLTTVRIQTEINAAALPFVSSGSFRDRSGRFDIAAGDFDGDGFDEIALLTPEAITVPNGLENWQLYVRFYDYDRDAAQFVPDTIPHASTILYTHGDRTSRWLSRVAGHAADFDGDGRVELAAAYHVGFTDQASQWYLQILKPAANFSSITLNLAQRLDVDNSSGNSGYPLSLLSGEFDGDPEPELVHGARQLSLINVQTNLSASVIGRGSTGAEANYDDRRFMALAQLDSRDPNTGFIPEIVLVLDTQITGSQRRFLVRTFKAARGAGTFYNIDEDAVLTDSVSGNPQRFYAVGAADFGGNGAKLGTPRRYNRTVTGKPTVIVNAPPVHFDVLGGTAFDVNGLFPVGACASSGSCPFYSRYAGSSTRGVTVETQWKRGWDFSTTVSGGFTVPIIDVGVDVEVQTKFAERLDSYAEKFETTRVEVQVDAVADDRIYAATIDYTVWEYPVLVDREVVGHIVVVDPGVRSQNWFGSKSIVAQNYRSHHEVGNLLSYRSTTQPYSGAEYVRSITSADTFTVDSSSSYIWRLTRTTNETTTERKTFNFSIRGELSFDIPYPFIPDVDLEGGYDTSTLNATTSTIEDTQGLASFLGNLDGTIAGTAYSITPYVYWDRSGAVVLDYAVNLSSGTPSVPTFWGQRYAQKSDPAFILPWRLDPEKGDNLTDPSLRQLTRDIMTLPPEPRPGESVNLLARVSNFSFLATPSTCKLRFYLGDPAMGGQLITGTDGRNEILVPANIAARGKQLVQLPWRIPDSYGGSTSVSLQIYAVIDTDNQIDETHEDNNIGWNEIFLRNGP